MWIPVHRLRKFIKCLYHSVKCVFIDISGNKGNDATEFVRLYNPQYLILEPLEEYANILKEKFKDNPK